MTRRPCAHPDCKVILVTQATNKLCRLHRNYAGRCCGDAACGYGARKPW